MADLTGLLQQLGFSEYEARAYLALLQQNPLNGYELAKVSGLPHKNSNNPNLHSHSFSIVSSPVSLGFS
jgi:hypothetical protein